jgi:hypothetical protein
MTAHRIWHTIQNDSTQREMLLNVAKAHLAFQPALLEPIQWIIKTAYRLAIYRNIAAHTPAVFSPYFRERPAAEPVSTRDPMRKSFNEIKHDEFWRLLLGDANALSAYTAAVATEIPQPGLGGPLPRKPRMRCLARIDRIEGQISRIAQSEERYRQQFASRLIQRVEGRRGRTSASALKR